MGKPIRVLIVDDSASVCMVLRSVLEEDPGIEVMGVAGDAFAAVRLIHDETPDVITLDVEMPGMDGITFLRRLMAQRPIPVVMCSSLVESGSETLMQALEAGAVDVILKPRLGVEQSLREAKLQICDVVKAAARARLKPPAPPGAAPQQEPAAHGMPGPPAVGPALARGSRPVVCIGASTGGAESLRVVLQGLPADSPGIVVAQHMPEKLTAALARRLDAQSRMEVREATDGEELLRGQMLIAPGNRHVTLERSGAGYRVAIGDGPLVARHRPSVDVLFRSAARAAGANALGIIMTGMGDDGARGLLEMRQAGAATVAQDELSCVVFGMPKEAIALGGVERVLSLELLAREIVRAGHR